MSERQDTLQQYVSDMLSVERHIHEAIKRQVEDEATKDHPQAQQVIQRADSILREHQSALERHLESLGGDAGSMGKEAVSSALGAAAGLIDKVRTQKVSKMLRDNYTAFSLAAISYTMLNTTGLALQDQSTANLAMRHLRNWTPIITEISKVIPHVVARELQDDSEMVDETAASESVRQTQEAWQPQKVT